MIISKSKGERLTDKDLKTVYAGFNCGGDCGNCDCTSSGGAKFYPAFDKEMTEFERVWFS